MIRLIYYFYRKQDGIKWIFSIQGWRNEIHTCRRRKKNLKTRIRAKRVYGNGYLSRRKYVKQKLINRFGSMCQMCKKHKHKSELTIDHIKKASEQRNNKIENLQLLCEECHVLKDMQINGKWVF